MAPLKLLRFMWIVVNIPWEYDGFVVQINEG